MLPLYNVPSRPQQRGNWITSFLEPRRNNIFAIAGLVILSFTLVLILLVNTDMGAAEEEALLKQVGDVARMRPATSSRGTKPTGVLKSPQGAVKEVYEHAVDEHPKKYEKDKEAEKETGAEKKEQSKEQSETGKKEHKEVENKSNLDAETSNRRNAVVEAFKDAYGAYRRYCPEDDELQPITKKCRRWFNLGLSRIDALDTMWLMGLKDEWTEALTWLDSHFKVDQDMGVSVFEAMIRITGGLLSAYDLSGEKSLLDKAQRFTDRLMPAFSAESSGIPQSVINLKTQKSHFHSWLQGRVALAEVGTVQMELAYLSHHTGNPSYGKTGLKIFQTVKGHAVERGLYAVYLNPDGSAANNKLTLNAPADSFYEYVFKTHLLLNKKVKWLEEMWEDTATAIVTRLRGTDKDLVYAGVREGGGVYAHVEQLACFAGGLFALSSNHSLTPDAAKSRMQFGADFTRFCREMYHNTATGLAPELVTVSNGQIQYAGQLTYQLRPETVESLFYLWRTTKDRKYRDWAWEIFQSIQKYCKTEGGGYSGISNVQDRNPRHDDTQHSWFLAETLKYFFLIFSDSSVIPLDKYVFNTEAHPLSIFDPDPAMYNI